MQTADYARISKAILYLSKNFRNTLDLDEVARVAGVTLLASSGFSRTGRASIRKAFFRIHAAGQARENLHDDDMKGVNFRATPATRVVSLAEPGERHAEIVIRYGADEGPLGAVFMKSGICALIFLGKSTVQKEVEKLRKIWKQAIVLEDPAAVAAVARAGDGG